MSNNNLSNENINESNVIHQDDTVDDCKKKKRSAQLNKAKSTHRARNSLEREVRKVYNKAKELNKDTESKQVLRYLRKAHAMIAANKDDDTKCFKAAFHDLWDDMIWLEEDVEEAQQIITDRAEVQRQVAREQIKADVDVEKARIKAGAGVQKCSIKSTADVQKNEAVVQGIGEISKSTTDVGVKMCGIKSTAHVLKSGAAVQGTDEIAAETEQAQTEQASICPREGDTPSLKKYWTEAFSYNTISLSTYEKERRRNGCLLLNLPSKPLSSSDWVSMNLSSDESSNSGEEEENISWVSG